MIPILHQSLPIVSRSGGVANDLSIAHDFHVWLQLIRQALHGPFIGQQMTGAFVIKDGEYGLHAKSLRLSGTERATVYGSGRLVICG